MIGADVDQIYGVVILNVFERITMLKGVRRIYYSLSFTMGVSFLPREIYNIISITKINLYNIKNKLVISNKIVNLHKISIINTQDSPNVVISRKILDLPLCDFFVCGDFKSGYTIARKSCKKL